MAQLSTALAVLVGVLAAMDLHMVSGQLVDADCATILGGSAPAEFDPAGGAVTDARLVVRECVDDAACETLANRDQGAIITQYRVGTKYIVNFESQDIIYDLFLFSDSSSIFQRPNSYVGGTELFATGGRCFTHTLTTDTIEGFPTARNTTDIIWDPTFTPNPTSVTFRAVARITGSDIFVQRTITQEPTDCTGSDVGQNIASCDAFYNGDTCTPTCSAGFDVNGGTATCTGGSLVVSGSACVNKIPNWCNEADIPNSGITFAGCGDKTVGATCAGYCLNPSFFTEGANLVCGANRKWTLPAAPCTYSGPCPLSQHTSQNGVATPSPTLPLPCANGIPTSECIMRCDPGYSPVDGVGLTCSPGGWNDTASCTAIPNLCQISSITGTRVNPGDCTTRDVEDTSTCTYQCDDDFLAVDAVLRCTGTTPIGWNKDTFSCESPLPTQAPVPTPQPTNFPLPTATVIPTGPTPPTTPTVNPFFLNRPTAAAVTDEGIYIIIGAGGGAAVLVAAACVGISLRSTRKQYEVIDEKTEAANHYVDERFGKVNKLKYNAFDNW